MTADQLAGIEPDKELDETQNPDICVQTDQLSGSEPDRELESAQNSASFVKADQLSGSEPDRELKATHNPDISVKTDMSGSVPCRLFCCSFLHALIINVACKYNRSTHSSDTFLSRVQLIPFHKQ